VHHVVNSIIAPFGEPIEARPPIPTEEERLAERLRKRMAKDERRGAKRFSDDSKTLDGAQEARDEVKDVV
jgi:small subunit ribosomal protein S17